MDGNRIGLGLLLSVQNSKLSLILQSIEQGDFQIKKKAPALSPRDQQCQGLLLISSYPSVVHKHPVIVALAAFNS